MIIKRYTILSHICSENIEEEEEEEKEEGKKIVASLN
jgi:hypothetical protein